MSPRDIKHIQIWTWLMDDIATEANASESVTNQMEKTTLMEINVTS